MKPQEEEEARGAFSDAKIGEKGIKAQLDRGRCTSARSPGHCV